MRPLPSRWTVIRVVSRDPYRMWHDATSLSVCQSQSGWEAARESANIVRIMCSARHHVCHVYTASCRMSAPERA
eukprot:3944796-Prymnesium_polylepis.1